MLKRKQYLHDKHSDLRTHHTNFTATNNYACRRKVLIGLTSYNSTRKIWIES